MPNIVQSTIDAFAKRTGMTNKSGSWYISSEETIFVLNLQKSNYAPRYFLNIAVWIRTIAPADFPKEQRCHIRTRLNNLAPNPEHADQLLDSE